MFLKFSGGGNCLVALLVAGLFEELSLQNCVYLFQFVVLQYHSTFGIV